MDLWSEWMSLVMQLRPACKRYSTFYWMVICLMAFSVRPDLMGVTSMIRAIGLKGICYERLLGFMHSNALDLDALTKLWCKIVFSAFPIIRINGRIAVLADGIKIGKEGRKMPAVKSLHQESNNNSKPEYIMGHSCQTISVLVKACESFFAVPLVSRIHEGLVFSNRNRKTLFDKILSMLSATVESAALFYFIADAYYSNAKMMHGLVQQNQHLIACVKQGMAVGYFAPQTKRKLGRPQKYGDKIKLKKMFIQAPLFTEVESPVYDEKGVRIKIYSQQLLCRSAGMMLLFVWVIHPKRGKIILMSTDLDIAPIDVIRLYGLRFKIECSYIPNLMGTMIAS